jgi:hypothetical protein
VSDPAIDITDETREQVLEQLRNGLRRSTAARAVDLDPVILDLYLDYDHEFRAQVQTAELEARDRIEDALFVAAESGNVAAAARYLDEHQTGSTPSRRDPIDEYLQSMQRGAAT